MSLDPLYIRIRMLYTEVTVIIFGIYYFHTGIYEKILEVVGLQGFAFICQIVWRCGRDSNPRPPA